VSEDFRVRGHWAFLKTILVLPPFDEERRRKVERVKTLVKERVLQGVP